MPKRIRRRDKAIEATLDTEVVSFPRPKPDPLRGKKLLKEMRDADPTHPIHHKSSEKHPVMVQGEDYINLCMMTKEQIKQVKKLFADADKVGEYPEKVNELIDKCKIDYIGTICTQGDGYGWVDAGDEG